MCTRRHKVPSLTVSKPRWALCWKTLLTAPELAITRLAILTSYEEKPNSASTRATHSFIDKCWREPLSIAGRASVPVLDCVATRHPTLLAIAGRAARVHSDAADALLLAERVAAAVGTTTSPETRAVAAAGDATLQLAALLLVRVATGAREGRAVHAGLVAAVCRAAAHRQRALLDARSRVLRPRERQ
jgi:hypothetical protein